MKLTKAQLRKIIKEELNEMFAGYSSGGHPSSNVRGSSYGSQIPKEEWEVWLGKDKGNNRIESIKGIVWARGRKDAERVAKKEYPGYGVMAVAHWESGGLDAND